MMKGFMERFSFTGLKDLTFLDLEGGVSGVEVFGTLNSASVNSLTRLHMMWTDMSWCGSWWMDNEEAFAQLLAFVERQTHLEVFSLS